MKAVIYSLVLFFIGIGAAGYAQNSFSVSGKVFYQSDKKPATNINVFFKNTTTGSKTSADGTFTLEHVKSGKYQMIVSSVGFETYTQDVSVNDRNIVLPDIEIKVKSNVLKEVVIKSTTDPQRGRYLEWFTDEFIGKTTLSYDCKLLNPEVLNLDYNDSTYTLRASSYDFLLVENAALGYRLKYLLSDFVLNNKDEDSKKVHFEGSVLFEKMTGTTSQERRWEKSRRQVYEGSMMHFLRAALSNHITSEGFRVLQIANYQNPERPSDSIIEANIKKFKESKSANPKWKDSVSQWSKKYKLPKMLQKIMDFPLDRQDILNNTDQNGIYAFGCDYDGLYITYNKDHNHHPANGNAYYLNSKLNTDATLISFNMPWTYFNNNGAVLNPNSETFSGMWGRNRAAGLLPVDYEPEGEGLDASENSTGSVVYAPNKPSNVDTVVTKLRTYNKTHLTEKAYLQFDKPYYATGDTIYFKAYVTMGERHDLSKISGVLHVDLIGIDNKANQSIKLKLVNGIGWGDFALPDSLPQGTYRVRAYTRWMRNAGDDSYFEKTIPIGTLHQNKIPESSTARTKPVLAKADLQFFPEGGELVSGISSKVALKAIGVNGMGIDVKGLVTDNTGKEVTSFASTHLGMGYFYLNPEEGKSYKAVITFADGSKEELQLPTISNKGISLTINNDSIANAAVRIQANPNYYSENKGKTYSVLIYSGGIATTVNCKLDSPVITMDIIKRKLFTGTTTVTLFSSNNEPIAERLIFIQNYDQLNLDITTDKDTYNTREKVSLKLNARTRADSASIGHFSIAITDESKVQQDENNETTILTNLLLTADLKGDIEQPNYYFADIGNQSNYDRQKELDLVMLTHGYRHFTWKQVLANDSTNTTAAYPAETSLAINGTAKNLIGTPLKKATVSLISVLSKRYESQVTDDKGKFSFTGLNFTDSTKFVLQAVNAKGKNTTQLVYEPEKVPVIFGPVIRHGANVNPVMSAYLENDEKQQEELNRIGLGRGRMLKEVKIKSFKEDDKYPTQSWAGAGHADQVIRSDQILIGGGTLSNRLIGKTKGLIWKPKPDGGFVPTVPGTSQPVIVVVDGIVGASMDQIPVSSIGTVEILLGANGAIYGTSSAVIIITTKYGAEAKDIQSVGILPITVQGFYKAREFYSPKYDASMPVNHPDLRSTIFWVPELVTDKSGNASIEFNNADGRGSYRVVIEGVDEKGNIGRQVLSYKVQ